MGNEVIKFLENQAKIACVEQFSSMFGSISIKPNSIEQSSGAVYGIMAVSHTPISSALKPVPGFPNLYPIYWGKDISPTSRITAHLQNHKNTGNVDLSNIVEIQGKEILFGVILVSEYRKFEQYLHDNFPPLRGTSRHGKGSKLINIKN
ncbi:hypothetical protein [Vibrio harveyi]